MFEQKAKWFLMSLAPSEVARAEFSDKARAQEETFILRGALFQAPWGAAGSGVGSGQSLGATDFHLQERCYECRMLPGAGAHGGGGGKKCLFHWGLFYLARRLLPESSSSAVLLLPCLVFFKEIIGLKIVCINNSKRFVLSVPGFSNILLLFSNCQFPKSIKLISRVFQNKTKTKRKAPPLAEACGRRSA